MYCTELFNNHIRGTAVGYAYTCARLGAIFGPLIIGMIMTSYGVIQVFLFAGGLNLVAAIAVAILGKETGEEMFTE
ncbi:MAG: MFS transporter [Dehalobacterium sp.]